MQTMYTPQLLAERWACSTQIVRHELTHERLKYFSLGSRILIWGEDVLDLEGRQLAIKEPKMKKCWNPMKLANRVHGAKKHRLKTDLGRKP